MSARVRAPSRASCAPAPAGAYATWCASGSSRTGSGCCAGSSSSLPSASRPAPSPPAAPIAGCASLSAAAAATRPLTARPVLCSQMRRYAESERKQVCHQTELRLARHSTEASKTDEQRWNHILHQVTVERLGICKKNLLNIRLAHFRTPTKQLQQVAANECTSAGRSAQKANSECPADEPDKSSHEAHTNADKTLAASGSKKITSNTPPSNKSHENEKLNQKNNKKGAETGARSRDGGLQGAHDLPVAHRAALSATSALAAAHCSR